MTLRNNDSQTLNLQKKTVQRISFILNLLGAGTLANVTLSLINVKCTLFRNGKSEVLFHEDLEKLALESMYFEGFEHALSKTAIDISATYKLLPLMVDLGSPLNLLGDDRLSIEVTSKVGWYGNFTAADCTLEVEEREAIGVETCVPYIQSKPIAATHGRITESLGDNITSIMLMNTEAARTNADADKVFESLIIVSDKYSASDNRGRLLGRRATQFQTVVAATARKENFRYVPNVELDSVQLTVELNGANVAAQKNHIVYRSYSVSAEGLQRANNMTAKHNAENQQKVIAQINS